MDNYVADSLKASDKSKFGKAMQSRLVAAAFIPSNWRNFFQEENNKTEVFGFLLEALLQQFDKNIQLVITDGETVRNKLQLQDMALLTPHTQREIGNRTIFH